MIYDICLHVVSAIAVSSCRFGRSKFYNEVLYCKIMVMRFFFGGTAHGCLSSEKRMTIGASFVDGRFVERQKVNLSDLEMQKMTQVMVT